MNSEGEAVVFSDAKLGTATILFTDVVESTMISQRLGVKDWSTLITAHFETVRGIVEDEGGSVVKTLGDGGMYVFPSGTVALAAAVRIQRAVSSPTDEPLSIRAGVHTGDVVHGGNDYLGLTVNKAARVAAAAMGEQILVSATTVEVVNSSGFEFGDPITVELKGIDGNHVLHPLNWR
jgi:class 3 adenylate cyclase